MPKRAIVLETIAYYLAGTGIGYFARMVDAKRADRELGGLSPKEEAALWDRFAVQARKTANRKAQAARGSKNG